MSSLPSTTTQDPEGMRNGSTSSRISTFPVNERVKLVSCDEQKGNLALFTFCDICFFMFLQQTYQFSIFFSCSHGTCLSQGSQSIRHLRHVGHQHQPKCGHRSHHRMGMRRRTGGQQTLGRLRLPGQRNLDNHTQKLSQVQCFTQKITQS